MDKEILKYWDKNNYRIKDWLKNLEDKCLDYIDLLKKSLELIINEEKYGLPNYNLITEIDYGDYQGTKVFIIGGYGYQPSVENHWYTDTYYGSCSGCDTLLSIIYSYSDDTFSEEQINDLWNLCLHLFQKIKRLH